MVFFVVVSGIVVFAISVFAIVGPAQRVDIDGGGVVGPALDREPITGPVGVLLVCGGGGGVDDVVGLGGAVVGWGRVVDGAAGAFELDDGAAEDGRESLIAPPLGRSSWEVPPWAIGAPLGRSVSPGLLALVEAALFARCPGGWLAVVLQAAQTRAATTAVAAALAGGATVPRIGMDATVAKCTDIREDSVSRARWVRCDGSTVSVRGSLSLDNR